MGTRADNVHDMIRKGRERFIPMPGEKNGQAILTREQVLEIREKYKRGVTLQKDLAKEYGVVRGTIKDLLAGRTWAHLPGAVHCTKIGHPTRKETEKS